jgi:hypothetical protein
VGLEAVAELVRRAASDTTVVRALGDAPDQLATLIDLAPEELQALRATTSLTGAESRSFIPPAPPADSGTGLLPPQGSGVPAATPIAGITGLPGGPPPPPSPPPAPPPTPVGPPPPVVGPTPPPVGPPPPVAPVPPTGPGPTPPQPPVPPPVASPPPPPAVPTAPSPAGQVPAGPAHPGECRCGETAAVATVAIVATTAISAITAITALPCGRRCDDRPTMKQPSQGGT